MSKSFIHNTLPFDSLCIVNRSSKMIFSNINNFWNIFTIMSRKFFKCLEEDRFQVERDLNREYRRVLVENGIDIAYPQVVINYPSEKRFTVSQQEKSVAREFADEQKVLSQNMEEQQT